MKKIQIWRRNGNPLQCSCLEIPGTVEPGGLLSMGSHRVGHDWSDTAVAARIYWPVYSFPLAAVTKYHKSSDFNRNVSSQGPGDQKSKMSPTGLTSQCQQEEFTWEAPGEIYSMSSPVSGGFWHSLACGHITPVSMSIITLSFWPWPVACGLLVPWPGFKLAPPAMEDRHLNRWTAREVPTLPFSFL